MLILPTTDPAAGHRGHLNTGARRARGPSAAPGRSDRDADRVCRRVCDVCIRAGPLPALSAREAGRPPWEGAYVFSNSELERIFSNF